MYCYPSYANKTLPLTKSSHNPLHHIINQSSQIEREISTSVITYNSNKITRISGHYINYNCLHNKAKNSVKTDVYLTEQGNNMD